MWATLWGLLLWEALFADVPNTLRTPFQTSPLDLSTPAFAQVHALVTPLLAPMHGKLYRHGPGALPVAARLQALPLRDVFSSM